MRDGEKEHLRKKHIKPVFVKVIKGIIKKNGSISRTVNEGDKIKQKLTYLKKVNEGDKKTSKKNSWIFLIS